jgi:hypothetical protein
VPDRTRPETNRYEILKQAHREVESAPETASAAPPEHRTFEDVMDERRAAFERQLRERFEAGKINEHEFGDQLRRFETDPEVAKSIEKELAERNAAGRDVAAEKDGASGDMADARAARLQRLQETSQQIERERQENDGKESGLTRDTGRSR